MRLENKLGRTITVPEDAEIIKNPARYTTTYASETMEVVIGIGKDDTASLIMTKSAWEN